MSLDLQVWALKDPETKNWPPVALMRLMILILSSLSVAHLTLVVFAVRFLSHTGPALYTVSMLLHIKFKINV